MRRHDKEVMVNEEVFVNDGSACEKGIRSIWTSKSNTRNSADLKMTKMNSGLTRQPRRRDIVGEERFRLQIMYSNVRGVQRLSETTQSSAYGCATLALQRVATELHDSTRQSGCCRSLG